MKSSKADQYPGYAPPRRRRVWPLVAVILLALCLTCVMLFLPVVMFAMVVLNGMGAALGSLSILVIFSILSLIPTLAELLWLLQIGDYVQFAMRVLQTISSLRSQ